jgi:hypothetical protein
MPQIQTSVFLLRVSKIYPAYGASYIIHSKSRMSLQTSGSAIWDFRITKIEATKCVQLYYI